MTGKHQLLRFSDVLLSIDKFSYTQWVYLPSDEEWSLDSRCAVLEDEEVPPEMEDDPDAGIPEFAKANKLKHALTVTTVQEIVNNAKSQMPGVTKEVLFEAFMYYHRRDAFMTLKPSP